MESAKEHPNSVFVVGNPGDIPNGTEATDHDPGGAVGDPLHRTPGRSTDGEDEVSASITETYHTLQNQSISPVSYCVIPSLP